MENYSYVLGLIPTGLFIAMIVFASIGVAMALLIDSQKRDQSSPKTPTEFSWTFLIIDNWKTILLTFLAVLMTLRFAPLLFPAQFTEEALDIPLGVEKWLLGSLFIGLAYNSLLQYLKDKADILKAKR